MVPTRSVFASSSICSATVSGLPAITKPLSTRSRQVSVWNICIASCRSWLSLLALIVLIVR